MGNDVVDELFDGVVVFVFVAERFDLRPYGIQLTAGCHAPRVDGNVGSGDFGIGGGEEWAFGFDLRGSGRGILVGILCRCWQGESGD